MLDVFQGSRHLWRRLELPGLELRLESSVPRAGHPKLLRVGTKFSSLEFIFQIIRAMIIFSLLIQLTTVITRLLIISYICPHLLESHHVLLGLLSLGSLGHCHSEVVESSLKQKFQ